LIYEVREGNKKCWQHYDKGCNNAGNYEAGCFPLVLIGQTYKQTKHREDTICFYEYRAGGKNTGKNKAFI
jgi:hypothetical protein